MEFKRYDVIIIGSGVSGLYAALNIDTSYEILMISKREITICNSALAQGGIAAVMDTDNDDCSLHMEDTLIAGGYENNIKNLKILVNEGPYDIENLIRLGVNFDKTKNGIIDLTLEGGHSRNRIVHHKDSTGYEIVTTLMKKAKSRPNITILENAQLLELRKENDNFLTDVYYNSTHYYYTTKTCVLATGGIGRIYDYTTNSNIATGDGIYFAYKMGAKVDNLSFIQFHPTAFADDENRERFLISESMRGEGAYLLNCDKRRFMLEYEPRRKELAPRDVVSRCIMQEQLRTHSNRFYLDISHRDPEYVKNRFPMIYRRVLEKGYDMTKEPIPIYPCQHYLMGGITVDEHGRTSLENLYAAGECAHTGIHGKNRLASNSLLEALVFSRLIALDINSGNKNDLSDSAPINADNFIAPDGEVLPSGIRSEIKSIMQSSFFVAPNYAECEKNLPRIKELCELLEGGAYKLTPELVETKSLAVIARIILEELIEMRNSKGKRR